MPIDVRQYDSAIDFISDNAAFFPLVGNLCKNDDKLWLKCYEVY